MTRRATSYVYPDLIAERFRDRITASNFDDPHHATLLEARSDDPQKHGIGRIPAFGSPYDYQDDNPWLAPKQNIASL